VKLTGRVLILTSLAHFANDGNFLLFPILITYYVKEIHGASIVFLGIVAIIYNLISGFLSTPVGIYADTHNVDSQILAAGIFLNGISVVLFALPFVFSSLFIPSVLAGALILGIGQSIYHPVGGTIITETFDKQSAPRALGINGALGSLGRAVIPSVLVLSIALFGSVPGLAYVAVYLIAASTAIILGLRDFKRKGREASEKKGMTMSQGFSVLYIIMIVIFLRSMFTTAALTFVPDYLTNVIRSRVIMGYIITAGFTFSILGQPFFGMLQSRIGGKLSVSITTVFSGVSFLIFLYFSHILILDFITYSLYAFFTYSVFPVLLGYVNNVIPKEFSTRANSLVWGIGQTVGGAAGISVLTALIPIISLNNALWVMLVFSLASMLLLPLVPRDR
jgi:FSR family fosmidomycin resistance protein-like MFS transporter